MRRFLPPGRRRPVRARATLRLCRRAGADSWRGAVGLVLLGILLPLLSASSCSPSSSDATIIPAGLKIQNALPAFPTKEQPNYVLFDVPFPTSLRLDLNQLASPDEITLSFWPPVEDGWKKRASTTSAIFWIDDFTPDPNTEFQRILIDGPRFTHPWLWEFLVKERSTPSAEIFAMCYQRRAIGPSPQWALLLFYDFETARYITTPGELFSLQAATVDLASVEQPTAGERRYVQSVDGLLPGKFYAMGVILDSNNDGIYDPQVDWWGMATEGSTSLIPTFVGASVDPTNVQILEAELRPPPAY